MTKNTKTLRMVQIALFGAIIAVFAIINIPIGPVPFSMALFGIILAGSMLPVLPALASVGIYVALGLFGLPIFSGGRGGPQVLFGATGGYIIGYFVLVFCVAFFRQRFNHLAVTFIGGVIGIAGCYAFGTAWFIVLTGRSLAESLALCVIPFILPDLAKLALGIGIGIPVSRRLAKMQKA